MGWKLCVLSLTVLATAVCISLDFFAPVVGPLLMSQTLGQSLVSLARRVKLSTISIFINDDKVFTREELSRFTGADGGRVYVAVVGRVYDVTAGRKHYGPDGGYSFFAGRDGSRAFVTGDFTPEGLTDDLSGFTTAQFLSLDEWQSFYDKDYTYVGKVVGTFYTKDGTSTASLTDYTRGVEAALAEKQQEADTRKLFPPCNSQWSEGGHMRIWCSPLSGGIRRDWIGVPRKFFQPGLTRDKPRCACVRTTGPSSGAGGDLNHGNRGDLDNPHLEMYEGCDPKSDSCQYMTSND